jgi:hypothetical protein
LVMSVGAFARIKKSEREKTFGADFVNFWKQNIDLKIIHLRFLFNILT